jgi:hypothetical protein
MIFDIDKIKTESDYAGHFFVLVKVGENLLQQVHSESLANLVKTLKQVKRNYLGITDEDMTKVWEGVDPYGDDDEIEGQTNI